MLDNCSCGLDNSVKVSEYASSSTEALADDFTPITEIITEIPYREDL
jgi:hypothetical protein